MRTWFLVLAYTTKGLTLAGLHISWPGRSEKSPLLTHQRAATRIRTQRPPEWRVDKHQPHNRKVRLSSNPGLGHLVGYDMDIFPISLVLMLQPLSLISLLRVYRQAPVFQVLFCFQTCNLPGSDFWLVKKLRKYLSMNCLMCGIYKLEVLTIEFHSLNWRRRSLTRLRQNIFCHPVEKHTKCSIPRNSI